MGKRGLLLILAGLWPAVACSPRDSLREAVLVAPEHFSVSGSAPLPDRWWTAFGDRSLNTLVAEALDGELGLKVAWYRLQEARALVARESAALLGQVDGSVVGERFAADGSSVNRLELGLAAAYELDLWGRIRSGVDAERLRAEATRADYQTAVLTLSAEVVQTWVRLMETLARSKLLEEQVEANEKLLKQLRNQFAGGQIESVDVLRQRQLLAATREELHAATGEAGILGHRLSVLMGRPPQSSVPCPVRPLPELPPLPRTGLPVELVQRRPDLQSALARLGAADREVAAAVSEQFPRLTFAASGSTSQGDAERLFNDWARSFAANLAAPLLDGGRRKAEVKRAQAAELQRLYEYGQAVLTAFREVEDALVRERTQLRRIAALEAQVSLANKSYGQLLVEYRNGVGDFIDVLTALTDEQQLRRELLLARSDLLEDRIALYRALAGGF